MADTSSAYFDKQSLTNSNDYTFNHRDVNGLGRDGSKEEPDIQINLIENTHSRDKSGDTQSSNNTVGTLSSGTQIGADCGSQVLQSVTET